jgi:hypothetical protein
MGLCEMQKLWRVFFIGIISTIAFKNGFSQLIEKAPPSPVSIDAVVVDSINSLVTISDIIITGYKKTKPYIIEREVPFKKGEYLLYSNLISKLALCKQQLMNTALFVDVEVKPTSLDSDHVFVLIDVKERWYLFPIPYFRIVSRNFNTWWVEEKRNLNRVEYGLKFMQNNVSGRRDYLNFWAIAVLLSSFPYATIIQT